MGDGEYILSKKPSYIMLCDVLTSAPVRPPLNYSLQYKSVVEIWESPDFHNDYEFHPVLVEDSWYWNIYRRKDAASRNRGT